MRESVINLAADARPIYGPYTGRRKTLWSPRDPLVPAIQLKQAAVATVSIGG